MRRSPPRYESQNLLWGVMAAIIAAVILAVIYTNITLRSIEKNLPNTLLTELNSVSTVLGNISSVVSSARIAKATQSPGDLAQLEKSIAAAHQSIVGLRDTYVTNNLVNASVLHAVIAPAIADLQIWLSEGISGFTPDSPTTLTLVENRISQAYQKASQLNSQSQKQAQLILDNQMYRLGIFQISVSVLFFLTLLVVCCLIFLLLRQTILKNKEQTTKNKLKEEHDLLNSLLNNLPLGIAVWDKDKNISHLNNSFTGITGYSRQDLPHLSQWAELAYPDPDYRAFVRKHWQSIVGQETLGEYKVTCKDGRVRDIEFQAAFLPDARIINTLNDVTLRNRNERALRRSREIQIRSKKMESLGLLAGGVAHDLNNILSGIVSYPELILMDLDINHPLRKPIEIMQDSGERATAIVQDLLTVARGVAIPREPLGLNPLIEEYLQSPDFKILQQHHPGIAIELSLSDDLYNIMGSRIHLRKLLMNLVTNGCEAIKSTGRVRISTVNSSVEAPIRGYENIEPGDHVLLSIADQGSGISDADLERIFEPFYSKKMLGRSGTGLGLAVVWNIVQDHQGYINVETTRTGTTFNLYFPVTLQNRLQHESSFDISELHGNNELILVVDDVEAQRKISTGIVNKLGYKTESVASGEAAVEYIKNRAVDLILLDMIMAPGIDGQKTYEQILQHRPHQKAIIVSGFAETDNVKETLRLGASCFLKKPLKIKEIGVAIKNALAN